METVMYARLVTIAAIARAAGSALHAEPPKAPAKPAAQPASHSAPVILAAADPVPTPPPTDSAATPPAKPHRAARVTTCRCGDQVEEQPEQ